MARISRTTQTITRAGLVATQHTPNTDGDIVDSDAVFLEVENAGAGLLTVTVEATASQDGLDVVDLVRTVAVGATSKIGPLPRRTFGRPDSAGADAGRVYVTYSPFADARVAVIKL